jgi:PAS domain S-box-containing protein
VRRAQEDEAVLTGREELLEVACSRIGDTDRPAYVKNSDLRYVAVNAAYAQFFGRDISDFIGCRSNELAEDAEEGAREDKERRAVVFGTEEVAKYFDPIRQATFNLQIESFTPSDDRVYIFGMFDRVPEAIGEIDESDGQKVADSGKDLLHIRAQLENLPYPVGIFGEDGRSLIANAAFRAQRSAGSSPQAGLSEPDAVDAALGLLRSDFSEDILDLIDVGICIYDQDDVLTYYNDTWMAIYRSIIGGTPIGMTARAICECIFDQWIKDGTDRPSLVESDREAWVQNRLQMFTEAKSDTIERVHNGRWLRCVNSRLPNGSLIGLRIDVTAMKERELLLSNHLDETALYRTILHDLPVGAFVRDSDHRLIYANDAYFATTGLTREEAIGKNEYEMFSVGAADFYAENETMLRERTLREYEGEVVDTGHQTHAIMTRMSSVSTSDGRQYVLGSMTDISVLKLRERQLMLAQSNAEGLHQDIRNIVESMPVGVMIVDSKFNLEYANDAFYDIWGLSKDDRVEGKTLRELMYRNFQRGNYGPDAPDFEKVYQTRVDAISSPQAHIQSEMHFTGDRAVMMEARGITSGRILFSYSDITALRRREREISDTRDAIERLGELMKDATHAMSQGLLIVEDGRVMLSNDSLADMLDIPPTALAAGSEWSDIFAHCATRGDFGPDVEEVRSRWGKCVLSRQSFSLTFHIAEQRWVQMEASLSAANRWLVVFTDVTEVKEREKELQRLLSRSEAADKAKSEFLANMSHEIRTPMNGVLGMAELLAKTALDARQKTFVDVIVKSGTALLTIINDILDFSKIDAGQMQLRKMAFDPVEAVEDVATLLSSHAAEKNIELLVRASPELPPMVLGDAGRFRQIITNLLGNAIKFTEGGHVLVDLAVGRTYDGAPMIDVAVADTGIGISKERLDTIFDKFSQVDSSSTRRHVGTGLGLAITAGLVDLFEGYLEVDSTLGSGSVFKIHLPLPPAKARREQKIPPFNVKGARVLVIDDNAVNRQILSEQLAMWGFDGLAVEDGVTGFAMLEAALEMNTPVDALILDYHMPDMNGADLARQIREDSRFDSMGVIFLTSMDVAASDKEFAALNGQAHLMKPARANVLRNTVIEVVRAVRHRKIVGEEAPVQSAADIVDGISKRVADPKVDSPDAAVDIVVAEDNEVNQIVFTQILQATSARFVVVKNGEEAVQAFRTLQPRVIIMDVSMPVMNGLQATRAIRDIEKAAGGDRHVPIIGVTAHALESDRDMCLDAGMDDYMSKPISPELLEAKVGKWLDLGRADVAVSNR